MPAKANPRNHRNNPYVFDGLLANAHHSAAGVLWRFRTEANRPASDVSCRHLAARRRHHHRVGADRLRRRS